MSTTSAPPSQQTIDILGVPIAQMGLDASIDYCVERIHSLHGGYYCFANVHSLMVASRQPDVLKAMTSATASLADGMPLVWISRLKGSSLDSRVSGPDFMPKLIQKTPSLTQGFIGSTPRQTKLLAATWSVKTVRYSPPFREFSPQNAQEDWAEFLKICAAQGLHSPPPVIWVGLGTPKQDLWAQTVSKLAPSVSFFAVGAAFDFLAGSKRRAPLWMRTVGMEWAFRLLQEPRRLWRRYLIDNPAFCVRWLLSEVRRNSNSQNSKP